jgi:prepilin-type N-terminal cleavage/methylation domain-containing protein
VTRRAFSLLELLVVLAIITLIASVVFPVLTTARAAAKKTACVSNFKQAIFATTLYISDYEQRYMPANYQPGPDNNSRTDRTWVQLVMPYVRDFRIFRCPADETDRPRREATFDQDLVPGDTYSQYYTASLRTNLGYNYVYFSPMYRRSSDWYVQPRSESEVLGPQNTLLFIDSKWNKVGAPTEPQGGGSYLVVPPCRYEETPAGARLDTFRVGSDPSVVEVFTQGISGWKVDQKDDPLVYGGAWAWHSGLITVARADGSIKVVPPAGLAVGCDPKPDWQGLIQNPETYLWDLR